MLGTRSFCVGASILALAIHAPAEAQVADSSEAQVAESSEAQVAGSSEAQVADPSSDAESEIIVTAQKREERLVEIPLSISVLGAEELDRKGIENMVDLSYAVPGTFVQEFGPGRQVIFLRGVANRVGSSPLTSVYLDEIPVTAGASGPASIGSLDLRTNDLERVEVLKGPQGTLYGAGAVAGTVRFLSKDPVLNAIGGSADVTALFTERGDPSQRIAAVVNLPLVNDVAGIRIVGNFENNGGWIDRPGAGLKDVNDNKLIDIRVKGLWRVTDFFELRPTVIIHRNSDNDGGISFSDADGTYRLAIDDTRRSPFRDNYEVYNLTGTYDFGGASLISSSTYVRHSAKFLYPLIGGPLTVFPGFEELETLDLSNKTFTQETRLSSSGDGALQWTIGGYFQDVKETLDSTIEDFFGVAFPPYERNQLNSGQAWAGFVDLNYKLTDRLKVSGGARYFDEKKVFVNGGFGRQENSWDKVTWRTSIDYELARSVHAYASMATGFRSGGFNQSVLFAPYNPEELITYEAGFKSVFGGGRSRFDIAIFRSDYTNYLRRSIALNPSTGRLEGVSGNLGDVTIKGVEIAAQTRIGGGLSIQANGAYIDSTVTKISASGGGAALGQVGDPVDYVPELSFTLGATYDFNWTAEKPGFVQIDYNYRDAVTLIDRSLNPLPLRSDNISLLNARIGAEMGRWKIEAFVENLLDERGSFDPWVSWSQAVRNRPRSYGLKVGINFD